MAELKKRIYVVVDESIEDAEKNACVRLVRAQNPSQVVAHIAKPLKITIASQDDLVALVGSVKVEEVGEETTS